MTLKTLATSLTAGAAAAVFVGAAAAGVTSIAASTVASAAPGSFNIPTQPAPCATAGQLRSVIDGLLVPGVPARTGKSDLVEGGIGFSDGALADRAINGAFARGTLPVGFAVADPVCTGRSASTTLSANGQSLNAVFFPGGRYGWVLSRGSALSALSLFG